MMGFGEIYFGECLLLIHNIFFTMSPVLDSEILEVRDFISLYACTLMNVFMCVSMCTYKCMTAGLCIQLIKLN